LLDQPRRTPALLIEGLASTADDRPVEFSRTYVRGDRTRYFIERIVVRSNAGADGARYPTGEEDRPVVARIVEEEKDHVREIAGPR
jgi:hypothetical protein